MSMELLAPAGGMPQLKAALRYGADAVYCGMKRYGLRAFAGNFDPEELREAAALCHEAGAKLYVTMNILPRDEEMDGFLAAARDARSAGADAVIVSDPGAALLLHEELPDLPVHISTQANVLNSRTARHLRDCMGARRIVLSRELSLEEIAAMRRKLPEDLELEAFVHGAMCVAYSGRCLLSAVLTGRSGNRGACAQPCRWQYHLMEEKRPGEYLPVCEDDRGTYLYSALDLCMLEHLHEMKKAGIASLKIEGRMKTAYYVATVVSVYRRALDLLEKSGEGAYLAALPELITELGKASHRSSNTGFYFGAPTPPAGAEGFTQSMEYIGDVTEGCRAGEEALVTLKNRFYTGDELEALTPEGVKKFTVTAIRLADTGENVDTVSVAGTKILLPVPCSLAAGDLLKGPNRNHQ